MHFRSRDLRGSFLLVESKNEELLIGVIHNASTLFTILSLIKMMKSYFLIFQKQWHLVVTWIGIDIIFWSEKYEN